MKPLQDWKFDTLSDGAQETSPLRGKDQLEKEQAFPGVSDHKDEVKLVDSTKIA